MNIQSFLVNRPSPTIAQANGGACQPSIVKKDFLLKSDTSKAIQIQKFDGKGSGYPLPNTPVSPINDYEEIISAGIRLKDFEEFKNEESLSGDKQEMIQPFEKGSKKVMNSCILD